MSRALPRATASSRLPRMIRPVAVTLLALALSACGFHLRNALSLPADLGPVRVVSPVRSTPSFTVFTRYGFQGPMASA